MQFSIPRMPDKRLVVAALVVFAIAVVFWSGSRYPRLSEKALMAGITPVEAPLGFDPLFAISSGDSFARRVALTSVNWLDTNKRGMAFGLLLAAGILTLAAFVRRRSFQGRFANTVLGVAIGTPLGVCVNCAAPIAQGLHVAGARLETTLAAMISSPTLNIVVLTMAFSLFPFYIAMTKLVVTLGFLLVVIPLLSRYVFSREVARSAAARPSGEPPSMLFPGEPPLPPGDGWLAAGRVVARLYASRLWYIVRTTVPLMVLAGVLGAVAINLVPWEAFATFGSGVSRALVLAQMAAVTLFGLFLPVPIAFDVVIASALMQAGLPVRYVMPLLFGLGAFSVYSLFIVWRVVSARVAVALLVALGVIAMGAGVFAHNYQKWERARLRDLVFREIVINPVPLRDVVPLPEGRPDAEVIAALAADAVDWRPMAVDAPNGISVSRAPLRPREGTAVLDFVRLDGDRLGLDVPPVFTAQDIPEPFYFSAGLAAGDVHNDGWVDLVVPVPGGVLLYANQRGERFVQQRVPIPALAGLRVLHAALVDMDNDGWLDIFAATYGDGNFWLRNDRGRFRPEGLVMLPNAGANFTAALAFADLDRDGDLDVVLGNWHAAHDIPASGARNHIQWNDAGGFRYQPLSEMWGETLSLLLSDLDQDGLADLFVGNDLAVSDLLYMGAGGGELREARRGDHPFPHTARYTMSIDSADLDNDLDLEVLVAQIAHGREEEWSGAGFQLPGEACAGVAHPAHRARCLELVHLRDLVWGGGGSGKSFGGEVQACLRSRRREDRQTCIGYNLYQRATLTEGDPGLCEQFPPALARFADLCRRAFPIGLKSVRPADAHALAQVDSYNVLLDAGANGRYRDRARELGLAISAWSWNAKFADLDLDGWQDLYVANGWFWGPSRESNFFFHNDAGKGFREATDAAGLGDYLVTSSYVYLDLDNDGALDIVSRPLLGPLRVFRNRGAAGAPIVFEVRDHGGNRFGVGTSIAIHYGDGKHQIREIKASGGFQSFDPPIAHFGLGAARTVERVEVRWSTGERGTIRGPFEVGARYRITRR